MLTGKVGPLGSSSTYAWMTSQTFQWTFITAMNRVSRKSR